MCVVVVLCGVLVLRPELGLRITWTVLAPALPLVFLVAPSVWRNICPLALTNQLPRLAGVTLGWQLPPKLARHAFTVAAVGFVGLVVSRRLLLDHSGPATAATIGAGLVLALAGGTMIRGKAGWCGTFCPLYAAQRVYGRAPLVHVGNAHCQPCVGCARNCVDLDPRATATAETARTGNARTHRLLVGAAPGLVVGYFAVTELPVISSVPMVGTVVGAVAGTGAGTADGTWAGTVAAVLGPALVSMAAYLALSAAFRTGGQSLQRTLTSGFVAMAGGLFYVFSVPLVFAAWGWDQPLVVAGLQLLALIGAAWWWLHEARDALDLRRRRPPAMQGARAEAHVAQRAQELRMLREIWRGQPIMPVANLDLASPRPATPRSTAPGAAASSRSTASPGSADSPRSASVTFLAEDGDRRVVRLSAGEPLSGAAHRAGLPMPVGCGAGSCGADPVTVIAGHRHLTPPSATERATVRRLGAPDGTRLACVASVAQHEPRTGAPNGAEVTVTTRPAAAEPPGGPDQSVRSVVVVGNGIAGLTTADWVRRLHPSCEVHLVGREPHHTYNRMALTELVAGHGELTRLGLLPPEWFAEHRITAHVGATATKLDLAGHEVALANGDRLGYDRLILATGAAPADLAIQGLPLAGAYSLRTAEQALAVRRHARTHPDLRTAVVVGAGPLGIEVAIALTELGLDVHLVDRHDWPARRLVDERAGHLLASRLADLGVHLHSGSTVRWANGARQVTSVRLSSGTRLPCDVLLLCTGTRPDVDLARDAGLEVRTGVVVDHTLRTSDPDVFAVGDAAEHPTGVSGLWYAAVEQAEVAAEQAVAAEPAHARRYLPGPAVTRLDLADLGVVSVGRMSTSNGEQVVVFDDPPRRRYLKIIISARGCITGSVVVNDPASASTLETVAQRGIDVSAYIDKLRMGDVTALAGLVADPSKRTGIRRTWASSRARRRRH